LRGGHIHVRISYFLIAAGEVHVITPLRTPAPFQPFEGVLRVTFRGGGLNDAGEVYSALGVCYPYSLGKLEKLSSTTGEKLI